MDAAKILQLADSIRDLDNVTTVLAAAINGAMLARIVVLKGSNELELLVNTDEVMQVLVDKFYKLYYRLEAESITKQHWKVCEMLLQNKGLMLSSQKGG